MFEITSQRKTFKQISKHLNNMTNEKLKIYPYTYGYSIVLSNST